MTTSSNQGLLGQLNSTGMDFSSFRMEWNGGGDAGGGDQGGTATQQGGQPGQGSGVPAQGQQQQQPQQGQGAPDYSLASGFLDRVSPEHRAIVEPYVKQWDAGVTRRFQELHSQYQPYTDLGDPEELQAAMNLASLIDQNPMYVYGVLHQALVEQGVNPMQQLPQQGLPQQGQQQGQFQPQQFPQQQQQFGQQQGNQFPQQFGGQPGQEQGLQGVPPQVQQELNMLRQSVSSLAEHLLNERNTQTQAEEDAALEQYLGDLHSEFGNFDENYILLKIVQEGASPDEAIKAWNDAVNQRATAQLQRGSGVPTILGGGGGVPNQAQPTAKDLSRKQTQSLVANVLSQAAQHRQ